MARIFTSGFETGAFTSEPLYGSTTGAPTLVSTPVNSGVGALGVTTNNAQFIQYVYTTATTGQIVYLRAYFYHLAHPGAVPSILGLFDAGNTFNALVDIQTDGSLILRDKAGQVGSASSVLAINTWHYVELAASSGLGAGASYIEARLNGASFATSAVANTGTNNMGRASVGTLAARAINTSFYFDDVALNDNTSVMNASWPGALGSARTATLLAEIGVATGGANYFYGQTDVNNDFYLIDQEQAKWARFNAPWKLIEPVTKGVFVWTQLDMIFDACVSRRIKPFIILTGCPTWANDGVADHPPTHVSDYADFATAVVNRYKARGAGCHHWELWNEPNFGGVWGGRNPDPAFYTPIMIAGYNAIKAADPTATAILGSLLALDTNGAQHMSPSDFLNGIYTAGGKGFFDELGYHPYCDPQIDPNAGGSSAANGFSDFVNMRTILAANAQGDMPIWYTEYGNFTTPATTPVAGVSQANQSAWMANAFTISRGFTNIAAVFIYSHRNDADASITYSDNYGIALADRTAKTAFATFKTQVTTVAVPVISTAPVASGTPSTGQVVIATRGLWTKLPAAYAYQWQDSTNGVSGWGDVVGATSRSYSVAPGEVGRYLRCNVTASNEAGNATASSSNPLGPVDSGSGGGGYGAVMSNGFFQRYAPGYSPRTVKARYKPTLRKQKV